MLEFVFGTGVSEPSQDRWREMITSVYSSLSDQEKDVVPPFYVHSTMTACIYETFDYNNPLIDGLTEQFTRGKVWAFCCLQDAALDLSFWDSV